MTTQRVDAFWPDNTTETAKFLFEQHYEALQGIARSLRKRKQLSETLLTADLIHEVFLKLREGAHWKDDSHFFSSVALAMRHVSIDHARSKFMAKRGSGQVVEAFDEALHSPNDADGVSGDDVLDIHNLMERLGRVSPQQAQIIDCRFFAGFTNQETADILGLNEKTVRREWERARLWFAHQLKST